MTCQGSLLLSGLKTRLESIRESNGYPLTIKNVLISHNEMTINTDASKCPIIEVVQGNEEYEHGVNGLMHKWTEIGFRLVAAKGADDSFMETFKSAVVRCIYSNSYSSQGNAGIHLADGVVMPRVIRCVPDYGVIQANRIYVLIFEVETITRTWSF